MWVKTNHFIFAVIYIGVIKTSKEWFATYYEIDMSYKFICMALGLNT